MVDQASFVLRDLSVLQSEIRRDIDQPLPGRSKVSTFAVQVAAPDSSDMELTSTTLAADNDVGEKTSSYILLNAATVDSSAQSTAVSTKSRSVDTDATTSGLAPGLTTDASGSLLWGTTGATGQPEEATHLAWGTSTKDPADALLSLAVTTSSSKMVSSVLQSQITSASSKASTTKPDITLQGSTTQRTYNALSITTATATKAPAAVVFKTAARTSSSAVTSSGKTKTQTKTTASSSASHSTSDGLVAAQKVKTTSTSSDLPITSATASVASALSSTATIDDIFDNVSSTVNGASSETTYVSEGVTLTGQDAVAALAAQQTDGVGDPSSAKSTSETKSADNGKGMSSIAIVGIVGGVLVGLIIAYLGWSQWRKKQARKSLGDEIPDDDEDGEDRDDEKHFRDRDLDPRLTRSSFGAEVPITPASHRQRRRRHSYDRHDWTGGDDENGATWYDERDADERALGRRREYDEYERECAEGYEQYDDRHRVYDTDEQGERDGQDRLTEYALTQYGDGMTAALADGMTTGLARPQFNDPATARSLPDNQTQNPFVPPPPVPRVPSAYGAGIRESLKASVLPVSVVERDEYTTDNRDDVRETAYGGSMYDAYTGVDYSSRPHTQLSEPSTSKLLPWLNGGAPTPALAEPTPPVPRVRQVGGHHDDRVQLQPPPQVHQGGMRGAGGEAGRVPPRPVMAQTPMMMGGQGSQGWGGQAPFPAFR